MGFFARLFSGTIKRIASEAAHAAIDEVLVQVRAEIKGNGSISAEERRLMLNALGLVSERVGSYVTKRVDEFAS